MNMILEDISMIMNELCIMLFNDLNGKKNDCVNDCVNDCANDCANKGAPITESMGNDEKEPETDTMDYIVVEN